VTGEEGDVSIDVAALLLSAGGDHGLLDELSATFEAERPEWIASLRAALAAGDAARLTDAGAFTVRSRGDSARLRSAQPRRAGGRPATASATSSATAAASSVTADSSAPRRFVGGPSKNKRVTRRFDDSTTLDAAGEFGGGCR
jgi:hypothetical protein